MVPLDLLREVVALSSCHEHGNWCGVHEAKWWPCPNERLRQLIQNAPLSDWDALAQRARAWHEQRFPNAKPEHVTLKACSEMGEVADAINALVGTASATGKGDVGEESADVMISLMVLIERWYPEIDVMHEVAAKLTILETPGAHKSASLLA